MVFVHAGEVSFSSSLSYGFVSDAPRITPETSRPCQFCPLDVLVVLDLQPVIVAKLASEGVTSTCGCSFSDLKRASAFRF